MLLYSLDFIKRQHHLHNLHQQRKHFSKRFWNKFSYGLRRGPGFSTARLFLLTRPETNIKLFDLFPQFEVKKMRISFPLPLSHHQPPLVWVWCRILNRTPSKESFFCCLVFLNRIQTMKATLLSQEAISSWSPISTP